MAEEETTLDHVFDLFGSRVLYDMLYVLDLPWIHFIFFIKISYNISMLLIMD